MGTAEITPLSPAISVIWEKQGEVPLELLFFSMLVPALPYPAWGAALLAPGQSSNPSLRGMALPGHAAW